VAQQVAALKEKVGRYVEDLIGPYEVNDRGELHFRWGSARVFIECSRFGEEEAVVFISIPFLFDLTPTPELFRYVALHADDWHFGHLSPDPPMGAVEWCETRRGDVGDSAPGRWWA